MALPESTRAGAVARRRPETSAPVLADRSSTERPQRGLAPAAAEARPGRPARTALHHAADGFARPSQACFAFQYLDEFHIAFEPLVDAMECELTPMLRDAGASADLLHEWALAVAVLQDFLPALADEIERLRAGE